MSDDSFDPWQSLAADLGVDASKSPTPPPPPAPTPQPRGTAASSSSPPSAPKTPADWRALAGELGIELPAEAEQPVKRRDPVADLLGFPPPATPSAERADEEQRRDVPRHERTSGRFEDRDSKRSSWDDDETEESSEREFESTEAVQFEEIEESDAGDNAPKPASDSEERPRRRRRRGGRGRGRGDRDERGGRDEPGSRDDRGRRGEREGAARPGTERGSEDRDRPVRSPSGEDQLRERPEGQADPQLAGIDPDELRDAQEHAFAEAVEEMEQTGGRFVPGLDRDADQQRKRRRRRGRRGRGSRDRAESTREVPGARDGVERPISEDLDDDSDLQRGYADGIDELPESDEPADAITNAVEGANGEDDSHHADEMHAKSSVRDIVTWKEAIGMIIAGNMEARSRNPEQSRGSHGGGRGSRGGRGRGRGRGGHRGG